MFCATGPYTDFYKHREENMLSHTLNAPLYSLVCPLFWRRFSTDQGVYCFKLNTDFMTWHDARDKCAEYGGDLVSIRGEEEADFVKNQVQLCGYVFKLLVCVQLLEEGR